MEAWPQPGQPQSSKARFGPGSSTSLNSYESVQSPWSVGVLGGLYAHRLTEFAPNLVRSVITLGSPLNNGTRLPSLPVPTTSIYSRNDRVVSWSKSLVDDRKPRHENVEVRSTHLTLGIDPAVMLVISDRLRTDPDRWKPFQAPPLMGPVYPGPGTNNADVRVAVARALRRRQALRARHRGSSTALGRDGVTELARLRSRSATGDDAGFDG